MVKMPILTAEAARAFTRLVLGGVRCNPKDGFEKYLNANGDVPLKELGSFFDSNSSITPVMFLAGYAINRQISQPLTPTDIARAYCVDHIPIVEAIEKILLRNGYEDEYFDSMRSRDFPPPHLGLGLDSKRLALGSKLYLVSCIAKVGRVIKIVERENHHRVRVFCPYSPADVDISNVITLMKVVEGDYIVIHFASGFTTISKESALKIIKEQQSNEWFSELLRIIGASSILRRMDLTDWFGKDLTTWTKDRLIVN